MTNEENEGAGVKKKSNEEIKYGKDEVESLLHVSATTFAILVSLGLALPQLFEQDGTLLVTNSLWWNLGTLLNFSVVMYPLWLYLSGNHVHPSQNGVKAGFAVLMGSYLLVFVAVIIMIGTFLL